MLGGGEIPLELTLYDINLSCFVTRDLYLCAFFDKSFFRNSIVMYVI